jgi:hypothetical protein
MVEEVSFEGKTLMYIARVQDTPDKTTFVTPSEANLQVGYIVYPKDGEIQRHIHLPIPRSVVGTNEVLIVQKGALEIDVYTEDKRFVSTHQLNQGDIMISVNGGHGFRMQEDTVLIEIKQGPYPGVEEKERF